MTRLGLVYIIFFCLLLPLKVVGFEGRIDVIKETVYDTSYYTYTIKGDLVRVDQFNQNKKLVNSLLVNMESKSVIALNPYRKLYKKIIPALSEQTEKDDCVVVKTKNTKVINGYICTQWRVRNRPKNSEIVYWVTSDGFKFFDKLMEIIRQNGNYADFYLQISDIAGYMPILAVERTLVRYEKMRLAVTEIEETHVSEHIFQVPKEFEKFEY